MIKRPVKCVETGVRFNTIREAAEHFNCNPANIRSCCKGERNVCAGMHWQYVDDNNGNVDTVSHPVVIHNKATIEAIGHRTHKNCKSVTVRELNRSFDSVTELAEHLGVRPNTISSVLGNKSKTVHGYHVYLTKEVNEHMEEQQAYNRNAISKLPELERKAALWDAYEAEQNAIRKANEMREQAIAKARAKVERRTRIVNNADEKLQLAVRRLMEAESELAELEGNANV